MDSLKQKQKQMSISDFKAHCTEELRAVEEGGITLIITRHAKVIAQVNQPTAEKVSKLADWIGSGGDLFNKTSVADFDEPTWRPEDWENPASRSDDPLD